MTGAKSEDQVCLNDKYGDYKTKNIDTIIKRGFNARRSDHNVTMFKWS